MYGFWGNHGSYYVKSVEMQCFCPCQPTFSRYGKTDLPFHVILKLSLSCMGVKLSYIYKVSKY